MLTGQKALVQLACTATNVDPDPSANLESASPQSEYSYDSSKKNWDGPNLSSSGRGL
jgi:hypothetical protein